MRPRETLRREKGENCVMTKTLTFLAGLATAAAVALIPSGTNAYSGNLVLCSPTAGQPTVVDLKPGLSCESVKNKIKIKDSFMDGCVATSAAAGSTDFCQKPDKPTACCTGEGTGVGCTVWDVWRAGKYNSKIRSADAATIDNVEVDLKGQAFGSCNFSGGPNSFEASAAGKFTFFDAGGEKVKGGKGKFFGTIGGDLGTQSASTEGLVTKGFAAGGKIRILIGIDLAGPSDCTDDEVSPGSCNANILSCNLGLACPPFFTPSFHLDLVTTPTSLFRIDIEDNADCVGSNDPFPCCMGAGTGNC